MKNNRGITLSTLLIYVIGMIIAVGTIATITSYFYNNVEIKDLNNDNTTQFTEFSDLFLEEVNKTNNKIVECNESYIVFSSGNQYTFENNSIYRNKIKICSNVEECKFSYEYYDSQYKIKIEFKTKKINMTGKDAIVYTLK